MRWFVPALGAALRGYRRGDFVADLGAGLTAGLIALPLVIGFGPVCISRRSRSN